MTPRPHSRDTLLTGMGFCLPGAGGQPVRTPEEFWRVVSSGEIQIGADGVYFGAVEPPVEEVRSAFPEVPAAHWPSFSPVHHYGLAATTTAVADAGLDRAAGDFDEAAVVCARANSDSWFDVYEEFLAGEGSGPSPQPSPQESQQNRENRESQESVALYTRMAVSGHPGDLASVQGALLASGGPCHTVTLGCASGAIALGDAHRLIAEGQIDLAVVTGSEYTSLDRVRRYEALREKGNRAGDDGVPILPGGIALDSLSRPYDTRTEGLNLGSGAVTLVLESREHAERRGAPGYARLCAQANRRVPGGSALGGDMEGTAARRAAQACLTMAGLAPEDIDYVNGGADGSNPDFSVIEGNTISSILGEHAEGMPVTVQEAVFGHPYAALSPMRIAATALMTAKGEVCPTAGCEQPVETLVDPVPGTGTRPLRIGHALSLNYYIGSGACALLLGREEHTPFGPAPTRT